MNVDTNTATTIRLTVHNPSPDFGDAVTLTATVAADLAGIGAPPARLSSMTRSAAVL